MSEGHPTMIGCPACDGCLSLEQGPHDHRQFVCSVGHAFALLELYEAKETELERAQWSTMALLKHLQMILEMLLESPDIPHAPRHSAIRNRLHQIGEQIASTRQLIEETAWLDREPVDQSAAETRDKGRR